MLERISPNLTSCDIEPIHIPGSIQPHGTMLIAERDGTIVGHAGAGAHGSGMIGTRLQDHFSESLVNMKEGDLPRRGFKVLGQSDWLGCPHDVIAFQSGGYIVLELTEAGAEAPIDAAFLARLESISATLERSITLGDLANQTARIFQDLTGYGRVMIYRFIGDEAGVVIGESIADGSASFMNHHFPGTDIPKQARALYLRNRVRVIADVNYTPRGIVGSREDLMSIDLSDSTLRSVSPVHIRYLKNMGVSASASMSIVKDGVLWGMVACHHHEARVLPLATRLACQTVATAVARQIKMREESELYRERVSLRGQEDLIVSRLGSDSSLKSFVGSTANDLMNLLTANGFAAVQGDELFCTGSCPPPGMIRAIADHVRRRGSGTPFVTSHLSGEMPEASECSELASGLIAVPMASEIPSMLMWFRAERLQTVRWAGNPHKDVEERDDMLVLTPRKSFDAWAEQVAGRAPDWSDAEPESAMRLAKRMLDVWNNRRITRLNQELITTLKKNENLIQQKDFLLKEVNHRVQNSLSIVSAFLRMQARHAEANVKEHLAQADQRLRAVGLVHRRLYQDEDLETVDLARYLDELIDELARAIDPRWRQNFSLNLSSIWLEPERAISLGLIVNELVTNSIKYAYDGQPGPIMVTLENARDNFRLTVADRGRGHSGAVEGTGFGSRMAAALVERLNGTLANEDNHPGFRTVLTAPIKIV
jgi:chemotaxis family two-component system sensor kinase Cph1